MSRQHFSMPGAVRIVDRDADRCRLKNDSKYCALQSLVVFLGPSWCQFTTLCHNTVFCIRFDFFLVGGSQPWSPCNLPNPYAHTFQNISLDILLIAISIVSLKRWMITMDCVRFSADPASSVTTRNGIRFLHGLSSKVMGLTAALAYFSYSGFGVNLWFLRLNTAWFHCLPCNRDIVSFVSIAHMQCKKSVCMEHEGTGLHCFDSESDLHEITRECLITYMFHGNVAFCPVQFFLNKFYSNDTGMPPSNATVLSIDVQNSQPSQKNK